MGAGGWRFAVAGQDACLIDDDNQLTTRVYAYGVQCSTGNRSRIARVMGKDGKLRNLTPADIVKRMREDEGPLPATTKKEVRRAIRALENQGKVRSFGQQDDEGDGIQIAEGRRLRKRGQVGLAFYLRRVPKAPKPDILDDDLEAEELAESDVPKGGQICPPLFSNFQKEKLLAAAILQHASSAAVKGIRKVLRDTLGQDPDLGGKFDPLKIEEEVLAEVEEGVKKALLRLGLGGNSAPLYKEDSSTSSSQSVPQPPAEPAQPAEDRPTDRHLDQEGDGLTPRQREILEAIPGELIERLGEVPTKKLLHQVERNLGEAPIEKLREKIRQRYGAITSLGLLANLATDVRKAWMETQRRAAAAGAAMVEPPASSDGHPFDPTLELEYQEHKREKVEAYIRTLEPGEWEERVKSAERAYRRGYARAWANQTAQQRREVAEQEARSQLAQELQFESFEEFIRRGRANGRPNGAKVP